MRIHFVHLALLAVMAFAGLTRMGWAGVNSFAFDEARLSLLALQTVRAGQFATMGLPSSTDIPNFPAAVWIFAIPYAFSTDPLVATLFVGLLSTLAVAGLWWLARVAWGPWAAFSTALLAAGSPYLILYSRSIWGQNLLPIVAVLWAILGVIGAQRKGWALAGHVFLAGFAFQIHYAGIALIPGTVWLVLWYARRDVWPVLAGALAAGLAALPFMVTVLCCAAGVPAAVHKVLTQPATLDLAAFQQWLTMGMGTGWDWLLLGRGQGSELLPGALTGSIAIGLVGIGLLMLTRQLFRGRAGGTSDVLTALVPVWALSAPLLFVGHTTPVYPQYQLTALPALVLAAGATASLSQRWQWGAGVTFLSLLIAVSQSLPVAQAIIRAGWEATPGGIGTPLRWPRAAARSLTDGRPIVVLAHGDEPEFYGDVAGFHVLLWDYPHRIVDGRSVLLIPGEPAHLFATFADLPAWAEAQASGIGENEKALPRRQGEPPYVTMTVQGEEPIGFQRVEPVTLANGVRLEGWRVRRVGDHWRFSTLWHVIGPVPLGRYHQFHHLRQGADGLVIAVHDVPTSSSAWQVGDTLIVWADFELATQTGPFWMDVGMYTYPAVERVEIIHRNATAITLGPFDLHD